MDIEKLEKEPLEEWNSYLSKLKDCWERKFQNKFSDQMPDLRLYNHKIKFHKES